MDLSFLGSEFGKTMVLGFGSGFMVEFCILGISSVVHKIITIYK